MAAAGDKINTPIFKLLVVALAACVVGLAYGQGVPCPESHLCPPFDPINSSHMYFPVTDNCAQYCECAGGSAWLFTCAPPLLFDNNNNICDWDYNVDCEGRPKP